MREIWFRGKRADNGEWTYGDAWYRPYGKTGIAIVHPVDDGKAVDGFDVDPETLGQYAGMLDKNGKRIYEGDIVKIGRGKTATMVFGLKSSLYISVPTVGKRLLARPIGDYFEKQIEVIGNIHDNPRLLTGGK